MSICNKSYCSLEFTMTVDSILGFKITDIAV